MGFPMAEHRHLRAWLPHGTIAGYGCAALITNCVVFPMTVCAFRGIYGNQDKGGYLRQEIISSFLLLSGKRLSHKD